MKKILFAGFLFVSAMTLPLIPVASAASLTQNQINAIVQLLQAFGADASVVNNIAAILSGTGTGTGTGTGANPPAFPTSYTKTEFTLSQNYLFPWALTTLGNNMWVAVDGGVAKVNSSTGVVEARYATAALIGSLVADPATNTLWAGDVNGHILKIDAATGSQLASYTAYAPGMAQYLAFDSVSKAIWSSYNSGNGPMAKVDATTGTLTANSAASTGPNGNSTGAGNVTFDPFTKSIWVTNSIALKKIDIATGTAVSYPLQQPGASTFDASTNSLWVAAHGYAANSNVLLKINPANGAVVSTTTIDFAPDTLTADPQARAVWATTITGNKIASIDTSTGVVRATFTVSNAAQLAIGPADSVWVISSNSGKITRFSPNSNPGTDGTIQANWPKTAINGRSDSITFTATGLSQSNAAGCLTVIAHPSASAISPSSYCTKASDYVYFKDNSRWSWNAATQTWTQTWSYATMPSLFANGTVKVQTHWRNMTTGEQKDGPVVTVTDSAVADLCAQQGLTNAAGQVPVNPMGVGQFSEMVLTPNPTPGHSFQVYGFGPNQALVFPITVKAFDPKDPSTALTVRMDTTTYTGIENIVSVSKDKCDFSKTLETTDSNGGRRIGYEGVNFTNISATDYPAYRNGVMGYAYLTPGNYYVNVRPALFTDSSNGSGERVLVRPLQDAIVCGDGQPRHAGSPCNIYVHGLGIGPDFTPFGTSSGGIGTYTCSNGTVVASANQCPAPSYTCPDGTVVSSASQCSTAVVPPDPSTTPQWGSGSGKWVYFQGPMQSSPPPPFCNSLVYTGGSCAPGSLCRTLDNQNRYVCQ